MTGPLDRAAAFVLGPAERGSVAASAAVVPAAARVVVVGTDPAARPLAAALALTLRAADRAPAALVAVWRGGAGLPPPRGAATRAAGKLAARLQADDLAAVARGRLTWLDLPEEPAAAVRAVHAAAALVDGPLVTALTAARPPQLDRLVEQHDLAIVAADPESPLARAALAGLADRCVSALACRPLTGGGSRVLALAGVAAPRLDPPLSAARTQSA